MLLRITTYLCFAVALGLAGAAAYSYYFLGDSPGAAIEDPERNLQGMVVGQNKTHFRIHNPTRHPVRIVGQNSC